MTRTVHRQSSQASEGIITIIPAVAAHDEAVSAPTPINPHLATIAQCLGRQMAREAFAAAMRRPQTSSEID